MASPFINTVSELNAQRFEPQTSHSKAKRYTARPTGRRVSSNKFFRACSNKIYSGEQLSTQDSVKAVMSGALFDLVCQADWSFTHLQRYFILTACIAVALLSFETCFQTFNVLD